MVWQHNRKKTHMQGLLSFFMLLFVLTQFCACHTCRQSSDPWQGSETNTNTHGVQQAVQWLQPGLSKAWQRFVLVINLPTAAAIAGKHVCMVCSAYSRLLCHMPAFVA